MLIIIGSSETYKFGNKEQVIHLPRIYINDLTAVREILQLLQKNKRLTNETMTAETPRIRSENIREFFQMFWELKMGVDVISIDKKITYIPNQELDNILKLDDNELKELILNKLLYYNPFVAILDKLFDYKNIRKKFTQQNIADDFHEKKKPGNLDNVHPLLRWANAFELVDVEKKQISVKGESFVEKAELLHTCYVHYSFDLKENVEWNILVHILSKYPQGKRLAYKDIDAHLSNIPDKKLSDMDIEKTLQQLERLGLPIHINLDRKRVLINNKIVHSLTSKFYVKCMLDHVDEIEEMDIKSTLDDSELVLLKDVCDVLIISDEPAINMANYTQNAKVLTYEHFCDIEDKIPDLSLKMIIISSCWRPKKIIDRISGTLIAFARLGGCVVIENINKFGRTGSNVNRHVWLPHGVAHISSVPIKGDNNVNGYFTFNDNNDFGIMKKLEQQELNQNGRYTYLKMSYHEGLIVFITLNNPKPILEKILTSMPEIRISTTNVQWAERGTINPKKDPAINNERSLYPFLIKKMEKHFRFEFDLSVEGKSGQTDIMIMKPFACCCEVSTFSSDVTASNKVSEVEGHRKSVKRRYRTEGKYHGKDIHALVFGHAFSDVDGDDKQGSVNMAQAMKITLMSYMDLYELMCINDKYGLSEDELKKIFCYENEEPKASVKINHLIKEKEDSA